jgi:hypothetical protein
MFSRIVREGYEESRRQRESEEWEKEEASPLSQVVSPCNGSNVIIVLLAQGPGRKSIRRLGGCNTAAI